AKVCFSQCTLDRRRSRRHSRLRHCSSLESLQGRADGSARQARKLLRTVAIGQTPPHCGTEMESIGNKKASASRLSNVLTDVHFWVPDRFHFGSAMWRRLPYRNGP